MQREHVSYALGRMAAICALNGDSKTALSLMNSASNQAFTEMFAEFLRNAKENPLLEEAISERILAEKRADRDFSSG